MKRKNQLYKKICDISIIMDMYDKNIRKNTKNKKKIQRFEHFYSCNMAKIKEMLITKSYQMGKYNIFMVHEPKARIIMSQDIEDKIVNHLVAKYFLIDVFEKSLSNRNCATRINKGTHYALRLFKQDYNRYLNKYGEFYILKLDISKYFYNLDHDIIKKQVRSKIKDKDVLLYTKGKGVCIGNMVSQIIATFYLDEVDKYIQNELKIKAYGRYMDDFYCMHKDKHYLKECLEKIKTLVEKLQLQLNDKTKRNFKKKMKKMKIELENSDIKAIDYLQVRNSYRGHLSYGDCYYLYNKWAISDDILESFR